MTILETLSELLALHGIDGRGFDRIDVALDALYKAEMNEKRASINNAPPISEKKSSKKKAVVEEHVGI